MPFTIKKLTALLLIAFSSHSFAFSAPMNSEMGAVNVSNPNPSSRFAPLGSLNNPDKEDMPTQKLSPDEANSSKEKSDPTESSQSLGQCSVQDIEGELEKYAKLGMPEAQFKLGLYNLSVKNDKKKGVSWVKEAAQQDYAPAQMVLYEVYSSGKYAKKDLPQAASWLEKAANQDEPIAQALLGYLYEEGRGVKKDMKKAVSWYEKAASRGEPNASRQVGSLYAEGKKIPKDLKAAYKWYYLATKFEDEEAQPFAEDLEQQLKPEQIEVAQQEANQIYDKLLAEHKEAVKKFMDELRKQIPIDGEKAQAKPGMI